LQSELLARSINILRQSAIERDEMRLVGYFPIGKTGGFLFETGVAVALRKEQFAVFDPDVDRSSDVCMF